MAEGSSEIENGGSGGKGFIRELMEAFENWLDKNLGFRPADDQDEGLQPIDTRNAGGGGGSQITDQNERDPER